MILKVGPDAVTTMSDWDRAIRANQGKPVQVTILRDRKQQTLTMQVDSKHNKGEIDMEEFFPSGDSPLVAELDAQDLNVDAQAAAEQLRKQAEALRDSMKDFKIDPKLSEEMRKQAEGFQEQFKNGFPELKFDQKQLDEFKKQMDEWKDSFGSSPFKFDQKQLDEWKKQMDEWQDKFQPQIIDLDPQFI